MKTTHTILAACAFVGLSSCLTTATETYQGQAADKEVVNKKAKTKKVSLKIKGMTWGVGCVKKVRSALESVAGVKKAKVSMPDKAVVTADSSVKTADLIAAVKKAGYSATVK